MFRHNHPLVFIGTICRGVAWLIAIAGIGPRCLDASAQAQILRWEIEGTVRDIGDLNNIFTDVRLGDPVRGFLQYDRRTEPEGPNEGAYDVVYDHTDRLHVAELVLENPRDGTTMEFQPDNIFALIAITNDAPDEESGAYDEFQAIQSVWPPPDGFTGTDPSIVLTLTGPPETLADSSLPTSLDIDDWPLASIYFGNFFDLFEGFEVSASYFFAEFHTLTPVAVPVIPGDYDGDTYVSAADYRLWRATFGSTTALATDGNGNGIVDAADYVFWRNNFGLRDSASSAVTASVPEPSGIVLLVIATALVGSWAAHRKVSGRG